MMVQLEDALGEIEQANMPGTTVPASQLAAQVRAAPCEALWDGEPLHGVHRAAAAGPGRAAKARRGRAARRR